MRYLALPQETCAWLLAHPSILAAMHDAVSSEELAHLAKSEFVQGPLRMVGSKDQTILAIWNRDYLSGTGEENWAVFRLQPPIGLLSQPMISQQVFERMLFVANQRLQGLLLDSELIHRAWDNGTHTCLAGRGTESRQFSIAYFEVGGESSGVQGRAIICIGPEHNFDVLRAKMETERRILPDLARAASLLLDSSKRRPLLESPAFGPLRTALTAGATAKAHLENVNVSTAPEDASAKFNAYETMHWTYAEWIAGSSPLNETQRRILNSDALTNHPVRVIGPAGSGKTLLMQLMSLRQLEKAKKGGDANAVLYVVHNAAMQQMVLDRFRTLGGDEYLTNPKQTLVVSTLSEYGRSKIGISEQMVVDKDAQKTKQFQFEQVRDALRDTFKERDKDVASSRILTQFSQDENLFALFAILVMAEISTAIKGHGLTADRQRYVASERPLSRLHRILDQRERDLIYDVFEKYHHVIFEQFEMLDSDDVALSLLGRLRTPIWQLKRRVEGFDSVFVDEAQLFNENERRIFPLLTKGTTKHVPIALALDEAQEPFGFTSAGLGALGIESIENESLPLNHRSTREIVDLAFYVVQRTTDLFGADFPDFTAISTSMVPSDHPLAIAPIVLSCNEEARNYGRFLVKTVRKLRARNIRQIAVICYGETYWESVRAEFEAAEMPLHVLQQRGERINPDQPLVVLSKPAYVGGQEFDAVVAIGLEQGVFPPRIVDNEALAAAVEQQTLRETYLGITRARYRVVVALNKGATANNTIREAEDKGLISAGTL